MTYVFVNYTNNTTRTLKVHANSFVRAKAFLTFLKEDITQWVCEQVYVTEEEN